MNIIDRLELESRSRVLSDDESAELARAIKREKWNAYKRRRYAQDPGHRAHVLRKKREAYARRHG